MAFHSSRERAMQQMGAARGDPGFFGSLFRGIKGAVGGLISGGPLGAIGGAVRGLTQAQQAQGGPLVLPPTPGGRIVVTPGAILPGGVPFTQRVPAGLATTIGPGAGCPKGFHLNKSSYHTRGGFVPAGSRCVRNRSRNFTNQRALRRATSRVQGFARQVKRSRKSLRALSKI